RRRQRGLGADARSHARPPVAPGAHREGRGRGDRRRLLFLPHATRSPPAALRLRPRRDAGLARPPRSARARRRQAVLRPRSRLLEGRAASPRAGVLAGGAPLQWRVMRFGERKIAPPANYSGTASPEPPNSLGKSFSLGRPSFMRSTVSA